VTLASMIDTDLQRSVALSFTHEPTDSEYCILTLLNHHLATCPRTRTRLNSAVRAQLGCVCTHPIRSCGEQARAACMAFAQPRPGPRSRTLPLLPLPQTGWMSRYIG
jgi:hypothetical protein